MRQLLLIVLLVSTSFLGGAFVNGPGLQWIQTKLLQSLKLNNNGEITAIELKSETSPETDSNSPASEPPTQNKAQAPLEVLRSIEADNNISRDRMPDKPIELKHRQNSATNRTETPVAQGLSPLVSAHSRSVASHNISALTRSDTNINPATTKVAQIEIPFSSSSPFDDSKPALLDSLTALLPMQTSTPSPLSPTLPPRTTSPTSQASAADNWVVLERKLQSLGVTRYTAEGTPGGSVVFSCLIPLAGSQAITERFEGEGDDIIHASQTAIRRIALWRASNPRSP